jgi:hypothetical protein
VPSPAEHEKWAKHNEDFARWLKGKWPQWIMTSLFYSALHYVDAFLRGDQGWNPPYEEENHKERNRLLGRWPEIRGPYRRLYTWSHEARYYCHLHSESQVARGFEALEQLKDAIQRERTASKRTSEEDGDL